jgi:hypothetical protein
VSNQSSDYGDDDDFDTDMIEAIDGTAVLQPEVIQPVRNAAEPAVGPIASAQVRPPLPRKPSQQIETRIPQPREFAPKPAAANDSEDEFDDDDDDLLVVDLNQITATYNSQQHRNGNTQMQVSSVQSARPQISRVPPARETRAPALQAPARREAVQVISDDEFGDDDEIDFEQLAAAEVAATQAYQASGHPVGLVLR